MIQLRPGRIIGIFNNFLDAIDGSYCTYDAFNVTGNSPGIDPSYPDSGPGGYTGALQCGVYKPTNVVSISYGEQEAQLPTNYQQRQCNEFMKLGLQGTSVVTASGDDGVTGPASRDGSNGDCLGPKKNVFSPTYVSFLRFVAMMVADVSNSPTVALTSPMWDPPLSHLAPPPEKTPKPLLHDLDLVEDSATSIPSPITKPLRLRITFLLPNPPTHPTPASRVTLGQASTTRYVPSELRLYRLNVIHG